MGIASRSRNVKHARTGKSSKISMLNLFNNIIIFFKIL